MVGDLRVELLDPIDERTKVGDQPQHDSAPRLQEEFAASTGVSRPLHAALRGRVAGAWRRARVHPVGWDSARRKQPDGEVNVGKDLCRFRPQRSSSPCSWLAREQHTRTSSWRVRGERPQCLVSSELGSTTCSRRKSVRASSAGTKAAKLSDLPRDLVAGPGRDERVRVYRHHSRSGFEQTARRAAHRDVRSRRDRRGAP